jgi:hypothetical protein
MFTTYCLFPNLSKIYPVLSLLHRFKWSSLISQLNPHLHLVTGQPASFYEKNFIRISYFCHTACQIKLVQSYWKCLMMAKFMTPTINFLGLVVIWRYALLWRLDTLIYLKSVYVSIAYNYFEGIFMVVLNFISECGLLHYCESCTHRSLCINH